MDAIAQKFIAFVDTPWAPLCLFVHAFLESSFLPGAHDFFLIAVNVIKPDRSFFFATFSTFGSVCGGSFGYMLGRYWARPLCTRIIKKTIYDQVEASYKKFDVWAVAFAAFTPVPYKIFAVCSGMFEINLTMFVVVSFIGRASRYYLESALLYIIGPHIKNHLVDLFNAFSLLLLSAIVIIFFVVKYIKKKNHE